MSSVCRATKLAREKEQGSRLSGTTSSDTETTCNVPRKQVTGRGKKGEKSKARGTKATLGKRRDRKENEEALFSLSLSLSFFLRYKSMESVETKRLPEKVVGQGWAGPSKGNPQKFTSSTSKHG